MQNRRAPYEMRQSVVGMVYALEVDVDLSLVRLQCAGVIVQPYVTLSGPGRMTCRSIVMTYTPAAAAARH